MFLIVSFGCLYFVCRIFFDAALRARIGSLLAKSKRFERRIVGRLDEGEAALLKGTLRKLMTDA